MKCIAVLFIILLQCFTFSCEDESSSFHSEQQDEGMTIDTDNFAGSEVSDDTVVIDMMTNPFDQNLHHPMDSSVEEEADQEIEDYDDMLPLPEIDMNTEPGEPAPMPGTDADQDGLDDYWEWSLNAPQYFHWSTADTNNDGTIDANEDPDGDGLTAREEMLLSQWLEEHESSNFTDLPPHPLYRDLFIHYDSIEGYELDPMAGWIAIYSFADLNEFDAHLDPPSPSLSWSVRMHILLDETLPFQSLFGDFESRFALLQQSAHFGDRLSDLEINPQKAVHLITAAEREDDMNRAGEVVNHPMNITASGVLIYVATINRQFPSCGLATPPPIPFVEAYEGQGGTLIHELGHTLQLGHDVEQHNGRNPYNVMSLIDGCVSTRQRYHGEGNQDLLLGATEMTFAPRFSFEAFQLMNFAQKLSVDVSTLVNDGQGVDH